MDMSQKTWYSSKTLWINFLAIVAIIAQGQFGYTLSPETQVSILAVLNLLLRGITNQQIEWKKQ